MKNVFVQTYHHSCLATVLLMIAGYKDQKLEKVIYIEGEKRDYGFYLNGMLTSFVKHTDKSLNVFVDNKFLTKKLTNNLKSLSSKIKVIHQPISTKIVSKIVREKPLVLYIDNQFLGDYSHTPHFVVANKIRDDKRFEVFNTVDGRKRYMTDNVLNDAILSLKKHIKMCPVIITMKS